MHYLNGGMCHFISLITDKPDNWNLPDQPNWYIEKSGICSKAVHLKAIKQIDEVLINQLNLFLIALNVMCRTTKRNSYFFIVLVGNLYRVSHAKKHRLT